MFQIVLFFTLFLSFNTFANPKFDHVFIIVFENENGVNVLKYPFFNELAQNGALLKNMNGVIHPSQGNYIAMVAGDSFGIAHDKPIHLNESHIADLIERKNRSWKLYAEDYPGNCFQGEKSKRYVRKHVPFISFQNVSKDSRRCANITNAEEFDKDLANQTLPDYMMYIPNQDNNGHDTNMDYSNKYLEKKFGSLFRNKEFLEKTLVIVTFDESENLFSNNIYTALIGGNIQPNSSTNQKLTHYSLLKMIEDNWDLGNLGKKDATADIPMGIWK